MRYYARIFVPNYEIIRQKTDDFLRVIDWKPRFGFHKLPWDQYIEYCPEILTAFESLYGLKPVWAATYITYKDEFSKVHVDNIPPCEFDYQCRINLPIRNCEDTFTEFYTGGEYEEIKQPSGERYFVLKQDSQAQLVDKVEMVGPTVMRVMEPHRVQHTHNMQRVNLTVYTDKDPVFLLD